MAEEATMPRMDGVRFDLDDSGAGSIVLNRPGRLNALSGEMIEQLHSRICHAREVGVRALVLSAEGRSFCGGGDLSEMQELLDGPRDIVQSRCRLAAAVCQELAMFPAPTVAAVQGSAYGGGAALALACDIVVSEPGGVFGFVFVAIGAPAGDMLTPWLLARRVGTRRALAILLDGAKLSAEQALAIGIVDEVVAPGELLSRATAVARHWSDAPSEAIRGTKAAMLHLETLAPTLDQQIEFEVGLAAAAFSGEELREGIAAIRSKQSPRLPGSDGGRP